MFTLVGIADLPVVIAVPVIEVARGAGAKAAQHESCDTVYDKFSFAHTNVCVATHLTGGYFIHEK